jgi:DNA-binding protein HU-beta
MSKSELVAAVSTKTGLTKKDTETTLNAIIESIGEALKERKKIQLIGFGTFSVKHHNERQGRNLSTKEMITIPAADRAHFAVSKKLNESLK